MYRWFFAVGALALAGCNKTPTVTFDGFEMLEFFEFDGDRQWDFVSTDGELPYLLIGVLDPETETIDDGATRIHTIDYHKDCLRDDNCVEGEFVRSMSWSANGTTGIRIHSYVIGEEPEVVFDPPLVISKAQMKRDDTVETETDGSTWTSTFAQLEPCPVQWNVDWDECARFDVDDGDGDLETGSPVSGTYWVVAGFNVVAMEWPGESGRWELKKHTYEEL